MKNALGEQVRKDSGRKRHLVVETMGLVMAVVVHGADIQGQDGVVQKLKNRFGRLQLLNERLLPEDDSDQFSLRELL